MKTFLRSFTSLGVLFLVSGSLPAFGADSKILGRTHLGIVARPVVNVKAGLIAYVELGSSEYRVMIRRLSDGLVLFQYAEPPISRPLTLAFSARAGKIAYVTSESVLKVLDFRSGAVLSLSLDSGRFPFVVDSTADAGAMGRKQKLLLSDDGNFVALMLSSYSCTYPKPNVLARVDLRTGALELRPSAQMTGDIAFARDSSSLNVFNICGGGTAMWRWSTGSPSSYEPIGNLVEGVASVNAIASGSDWLVELSAEDPNWYSRRLARVSAVTGEVIWRSEGSYTHGAQRRSVLSASEFVACSAQGLSHRIGQNEVLMKTPGDFHSVYTSSDRRVAAAYRAYSRQVEVWGLGTHAKLADLELEETLPWGSSELLELEVASAPARAITAYFYRGVSEAEGRIEKATFRY